MVYTTIKITRGACGIKLYDEKGTVRHACKTPADGPFECEIEQAKRLVELGVAAFVSEGATAGQNDGQQEGNLDAAQLEAKTIKELEAYAGEIGADVTGCKKKAEYIAAILAAQEEIDGNGDELPNLDAADPE